MGSQTLVRTKSRKQIAKIPLTEEEHQNLITPPMESLEKFRTNTQRPDDWYIVTFRIRVGLLTAQRDYSQEVVDELQRGLDVCWKCHAKYQEDQNYNWSVTTMEFIAMYDAVALVNDIQRDASRETLMFATKKVYADMLKYAA